MANVVRVELLVDVAEGGRNLAKACAAADEFGLPKFNQYYPRLKVTRPGTAKEVQYVKGLVITMTEPDAAKWVSRGIGKVV